MCRRASRSPSFANPSEKQREVTCRRFAACLALAAGATLADCPPVPAASGPTAIGGPVVTRRKPAAQRKPVVRRSAVAPQWHAGSAKQYRKAASLARATATPQIVCGEPPAAPATAVGGYSETIALPQDSVLSPPPAVETAPGSISGELVPPAPPVGEGAAGTEPAPPSAPGWPTSVPGLLPTAPYVLLPFAPVSGVPEPSTTWLALAGVALLAAHKARRSRRRR